MQIDFHHAVTYVAAPLAGMDHAKADIIAYAAQYVDDATNHGFIRFDNGGTYSRVASAHIMLDYSNFSELANHRAWVPFHFLPANERLFPRPRGAPAPGLPGAFPTVVPSREVWTEVERWGGDPKTFAEPLHGVWALPAM